MIRGTCVLPAGTGKELKVCVFADGEMQPAVVEAGADVIGSEQVVADIVSGALDVDRILATKEFLPQLKRHARFLGPRGLIPNKKSGTLVAADELVERVRESKKGLVEFRVNPESFILVKVGMRAFEDAGLVENFDALMTALAAKRPEAVKGRYFERAVLKSTMGPPFKVDLSKYSAMVAASQAL